MPRRIQYRVWIPATVATNLLAFAPGAQAREHCDHAPEASPPPADPAVPPPESGTTPGRRNPTPAPPPGSAAEALGRTGARVKCLDESLVDEFGRARARQGVMRRPFLKARRLNISLGGGAYAGDLADTSWQAGAALAFWITEEFGVDAAFRLTPYTLRIERSATSFTGQNRYPDGQVENLSYAAVGHLLWAPLHTKLRGREDKIIHGDFVLFGGAGPTFHQTSRGVSFEVGASLYLYPAPWLSLRLDLADHILAQEILGSRRISNSLVFSVGTGFWIPGRR